nr:hypothetical protein [Tanacetum cinerariifolium]
MEPKDTLSSYSDSDEQDMQQMLKRSKILKGSCQKGLSALTLNFTRKHVQGITKSEFERAFSHIFSEDVDTFTRTFSQKMDTLEQQLTKETIIKYNGQNAFRVLKTQFEKIFTSVLVKPSTLDGKLVLQPHRNQSVVRQPTAFKSKRPRTSKPQFASQVDVNNDLSKPVTTYYFPKERDSAVVKPHHMITSSESRNSLKNMPRFSSNDMVHNHHLEEAKRKTQECGRNSRPSVMQSTKSQSITIGSKPKPRSITKTLGIGLSELGIHDHNNEPSSSKLVPKVVPPANKTATSQRELELLFSPMYKEYFNAGNQSVSKSFVLSLIILNNKTHNLQRIINLHQN